MPGILICPSLRKEQYMHYYGTRLSENISRREPEGYLLCLNVPVARTGTQEYLPEELGLPPGSSFIPVFRPEEEVFSPETMASFEGMPVTDDHPPEGVDVSNIRALQKGHAHNVRRGSGEESDLLLADLIITDPGLIERILEEGKREISCGYTYELREENGQYIQRKIRGNHVAVVDAGRAGPRVSIKDEQPSKSPIWETDAMLQPPGLQPGTRRSHHKPERSKTNMKKSLSKILARMAKDGDIETVAEIIEEMMEPEAAEEVAEAVEEAAEAPAAVIGTSAGNTIVLDEAALSDIVSRLDQIISLLTPAPAPAEDETAGEAAAAPAEEIAEAVEEAVEAAVAEEEAGEPVLPEVTTVEEITEMIGQILETAEEDACGEEEGEVISTGDALRAALRTVGPILAKMPKDKRRKACADIAAKLQGKPVRSVSPLYTALAAVPTIKPEEVNPMDLGKRIMANRSANRKSLNY